MAEITVTIEGARDSAADYDDDEFLRADEAARAAISRLYDSGAKVANIEEAVQGGLEDADTPAVAGKPI